MHPLTDPWVWMACALGIGLCAVASVIGGMFARARRAKFEGELAVLRHRLDRAERLAIAGEFATSVAHEIKNPLAPIKGYAQLLERKLSVVPEGEREHFEKGLRIIREETERLEKKVAELLDLARPDRSRSTKDDRCDLNRVVNEAALLAEGEPGLAKLIRRLDPAVGAVVGNADDVRGALLNLMKNGAEAKTGATLEVHTKLSGEHAIVEIADDGPGIPAAIGERVFEAFYTTKSDGTGLGLAIAKSAIEAAGGTIMLTPRAGGGTIARIELRSWVGSPFAVG